MKKLVFAAGAAALMALGMTTVPAQAQPYGYYRGPAVVVPAPPPPPHGYYVQPRPYYEFYNGRGDDRRGYGYRRDSDRDGVPNRYDRDRDGDGVPNRYDRRPDNPYRY